MTRTLDRLAPLSRDLKARYPQVNQQDISASELWHFTKLNKLKLREDLVSLKDGLDLATAAGRLMANVLASVAAYETEVRAERISITIPDANGVPSRTSSGSVRPSPAKRGTVRMIGDAASIRTSH